MANQPAFYATCRHLRMELYGQALFAPSKGLIGIHGRGGKMDGALRHIEGIAMPVQDSRPIRRQVSHGCMPTLLSETQGGPTQLFGRTRINLCAQGACHELSPQAYPNSG